MFIFTENVIRTIKSNKLKRNSLINGAINRTMKEVVPKLCRIDSKLL